VCPPRAGERAKATTFGKGFDFPPPSAFALSFFFLASSAAFLDDSESEKGKCGKLLASRVALAIHFALAVVVFMHRSHSCRTLYGTR